MKPEPLKDKIRIVGMGYMYPDRRVKSAVEWLKGFFWNKQGFDGKYIQKRIDKAFEDVIKK
ncbi:MAG: hypothetical protein QQN64_08175 [Nitrosopumilus sp.]